MNVIYALLTAIGFIPFAIILYKINKVKRMKKFGVKAAGTVREVPFGSYRNMNKVLIEYTVKGNAKVITKEIIVAGMPYQVGDNLPLYYDSQNPHKMVLDSGKGFTIMLLFTLLLAIFIIAACFMINYSIETGQM